MGTAKFAMLSASVLALIQACSPVPTPDSPSDKDPLEGAKADPESVKAMNEPPPVKNQETPDMAFLQDMAGRSAKQALKCDAPENKGPREVATVDVTFEAIGRSGKIVVHPPHEGTAIGECIKRAFEGVIVTGWKGESVVVNQKVDFSEAKKK